MSDGYITLSGKRGQRNNRLMVERKCERTGARRQVERVEKVSSSVATGGHRGARAPPTVDRHGHRIRANPRRFFSGWGD